MLATPTLWVDVFMEGPLYASRYPVSRVYQRRSQSISHVLSSMPAAVVSRSLLGLLYPIMLIELIYRLLCNL